jgi:hypothetical protein
MRLPLFYVFVVSDLMFDDFRQAITMHIGVPKPIFQNENYLKPLIIKGYRNFRHGLVRECAKKQEN